MFREVIWILQLRWGSITAKDRSHLSQHPANRADDLGAEPDQQQDEGDDNREHHDWMEGGESRKPNREYIFDDAQEDV
jgi:hypothetical protein